MYIIVNGHEQSYVLRMSYVLNENSDLLPLNSHILSLGMQYVKKNETDSFLKMVPVIKVVGAVIWILAWLGNV